MDDLTRALLMGTLGIGVNGLAESVEEHGPSLQYGCPPGWVRGLDGAIRPVGPRWSTWTLLAVGSDDLTREATGAEGETLSGIATVQVTLTAAPATPTETPQE